MKIKDNYLFITFILCILLILSIMAAVTIGSVPIAYSDVYETIAYKLFKFGNSKFSNGPIHDVVLLIRLPRLILAVGVGAGLSVSGLIMQAVVRNPLADPYVLGISSGSYLGAVLAIILGIGTMLGDNFVGIMAFFGAFLASLAVIALSNVGGRPNVVKLLLAGMALSAVFSAFSNFIIFRTTNSSSVQAVVNWMMGSLGAAKWSVNIVILPIVFTCILFFWSQFRSLNLMLLGDETAVTLGTESQKRRIVYLLISSLMVGFSVFAAGMIGFVGLVIPHAMRMLFGSDHKKLVPLCAISGSIFLVWADVLCRTIIPGTELPIGILTAMIGGPCFVYLMANQKYNFGGNG